MERLKDAPAFALELEGFSVDLHLVRRYAFPAATWACHHPVRAGLERDLTFRLGPIEPVLARIDPLLLNPPQLTQEEFENLVAFVRTGLREVAMNNMAKLPFELSVPISRARLKPCRVTGHRLPQPIP